MSVIEKKQKEAKAEQRSKMASSANADQERRERIRRMQKEELLQSHKAGIQYVKSVEMRQEAHEEKRKLQE